MARLCLHVFSFFQVIEQGNFHLLAKINNFLISTFSYHAETTVFKIDIRNIQPHTFRHTQPGSEKKCYNSNITCFCFQIVALLVGCQIVAEFLHGIQDHGNFIRIKLNNGFFMDFWHIHNTGRVIFNHFMLIQIVKKASERGNLPGNADFAVCHCLTCILAFVNFQIILKFLNICGTKIFHNIKGNVTERRIFQSGICGCKKLKENL